MNKPGDASSAAALIGIDWGSTGMRGFLIGNSGLILATRNSSAGASTLTGAAQFEDALQQLTGDWQQARPGLPLLACGMVGSQHGWQEVSYASCPIEPVQLAAQLAPANSAGLRIVPGLLHAPEQGVPDVMRGEETQIVGALHAQPELTARACIIMPGTHSKWVRIQDGRIDRFATHMTGELFAVLSKYSVLGRLMAPRASADLPAFFAGVDAVRDASAPGLTHQLFSARSLPLSGKMRGEEVGDYLSGLLITHELLAGLAWRRAADLQSAPMVLVGEPDLCQRYALALQRLGWAADLLLPNTAPAGLWFLAHSAGLLGGMQPSFPESM